MYELVVNYNSWRIELFGDKAVSIAELVPEKKPFWSFSDVYSGQAVFRGQDLFIKNQGKELLLLSGNHPIGKVKFSYPDYGYRSISEIEIDQQAFSLTQPSLALVFQLRNQSGEIVMTLTGRITKQDPNLFGLLYFSSKLKYTVEVSNTSFSEEQLIRLMIVSGYCTRQLFE